MAKGPQLYEKTRDIFDATLALEVVANQLVGVVTKVQGGGTQGKIRGDVPLRNSTSTSILHLTGTRAQQKNRVGSRTFRSCSGLGIA